MLNQQTLNRAASFSGIGLHSGNRVNMTILPAPANSGVRFRRVDLDGKPEIEARVENVGETNRSTTLGKGNVKIHTVEHVLAALAGFGIDNAIIELDANEPPIADGSSREFCKIIQAAGIVPQVEKRESFTPSEPIELESGETVMTLFPDDGFKITCTSADKNGRFTQFYSTEITPKTWEKELSHARTFCFYEEIEHLIKNNLIKGGSLENAIVIRDDAVLTTEPLRYPEEFVRHKMLDIVGDLSLLGKPIRGHLIAVKPSHAANCEIVRQIDPGADEQAVARGADVRAAAAKSAAGAAAPELPANRRRDDRGGGHEIPPAPLSVFDGGPDFEDRGQQNHRPEKRDDQRAVFSGAFSGASDHAGRAAIGGDGAGRGHVAAEDHRGGEPDRVFHVRREREMAQAGFPGRRADH